MNVEVVCPKCGGRLTLEYICQYGIQYKVKPSGELCKCAHKKDHGSMDFSFLFCEACEWQADELEFDCTATKVELFGGVNDENA